MANISKPTDINKIWAASGDVLAPSDTKISQGWSVEIPPRQYFNYIDGKQDQAIAHINQHGIAVWDTLTQYQANSSYTQGSDGRVYKAKQTNTNQDPVLDTTNIYWDVAFASALTSYTKTEVDAKTTLATSAQAQAHTSNNTLITPLTLLASFQGASNQLLAVTGFQTIGNFIIQWAVGTSDASGNMTVTLPKPFPNGILGGLANEAEPAGWSATRATVWGFDTAASTSTTAVARVRNIVGNAGPTLSAGIAGRVLVWGY